MKTAHLRRHLRLASILDDEERHRVLGRVVGHALLEFAWVHDLRRHHEHRGLAQLREPLVHLTRALQQRQDVAPELLKPKALQQRYMMKLREGQPDGLIDTRQTTLNAYQKVECEGADAHESASRDGIHVPSP